MPPPPPQQQQQPSLRSSHGRDRSFRGRQQQKSSDEELVLFSEMRKHKSGNLFRQTAPNLLEIPSIKPAMSDAPAQAASTDLLKTDGDRNEYNWLLTPPGTPLFPSFGDGKPQKVAGMLQGGGRLLNEKAPRTSSGGGFSCSRRGATSIAEADQRRHPASPKLKARQRTRPGVAMDDAPLPTAAKTPNKASSAKSGRQSKESAVASAPRGQSQRVRRQLASGAADASVQRQPRKARVDHKRSTDSASNASATVTESEQVFCSNIKPGHEEETQEAAPVGLENLSLTPELCSEAAKFKEDDSILAKKPTDEHLTDPKGSLDLETQLPTTRNSSPLILEQQVNQSFQDAQNGDNFPQEPSGPLIEAPSRRTQRSISPEQAAEAMLSCNSIAHGVAYKTATTGIVKSAPTRKYFLYMYRKRLQHSRKNKSRKQEIDSKKTAKNWGDAANSQRASKCCCAVM